MDNDEHLQKTRTTSIAIFAIIAAVALLGVVVITVAVTIPQQEAEARQPPGRGCEFTAGGNASKTRCVH
jgi:flagellar basal body-associated protein FliL